MENKKEKKGFWASLFTSKPVGCCCGSQIEEVKDEPVSQAKQDEEIKEKKTPCNCAEDS